MADNSGNAGLLFALGIAVIGGAVIYGVTKKSSSSKSGSGGSGSGGGGGTSVPQLYVLNSGGVVYRGLLLFFSFSGFNPNDSIDVFVTGGGGLTMQSDSTGSGSSNFTDNDAPGPHTLNAKDSAGHTATASFTVYQLLG